MTVRVRLLVTTVAFLFGALAALTVGYYLVLSHQLEASANTELRARSQSVAANVVTEGKRVNYREANGSRVLDSGVWVFTAEGAAIERPRFRGSIDDAAERLRDASDPTFVDTGAGTRLMAVPVLGQGRQIATVVVGIPTAPFENAERTALLTAIALDLAILLLAGLTVRRLVTSALRPVAEMTRQVSTWSVRNLDRRFGLEDGRDEISQLAQTFDDLLSRLEVSLHSEQRLTAEIAHELRTPLTRMKSDVDIVLRRGRVPSDYRDALERTRQEMGFLATTIEALLTTAESRAADAYGVCDLRDAAAEAVAEHRAQATARGVRIEMLRGSTNSMLMLAACDPTTALRLLSPVVSNAVAYATSLVEVAVHRSGNDVLIEILDDGPGVDPAEQQHIFEAGVRGSAASATPGSGLGLALARRLARLAGGEVTAVDAEGGGFEIRLPAAEPQVGSG